MNLSLATSCDVAAATISRTHVLGPAHDIAKEPVIRARTHRDFPTWTPDEAHNAPGNSAAVRPLQLRRGNPARTPHSHLLGPARDCARRPRTGDHRGADAPLLPQHRRRA